MKNLAATDDATSTVIVVIRRGAFRVVVGLGELAPIEDQIFAAAIQRKITGQPAVLPRGRE